MPDDLHVLAEDSARDAQMYLDTVTEVAAGTVPEATIPMCLLATSQVLVMGARLGAIQDVVLEERYEADVGPDPELDPLRESLANLFEGLDDYVDLVDPVTSTALAPGSLSDDLVQVALALAHGLRHYRAGRTAEALWWWQFSYLSDWGQRAAMTLRVLQSILCHIRLDVDEEVVAEAEFDALHP
jgi:Domain of unknown function (DUF5063)